MKIFSFEILILVLTLNASAQISNYTFTPRVPLNKPSLQAISYKPFNISDAKSKEGKIFKGTDLVKAVSGKELTVDEYLTQANELELQMNKKGGSLRNFKLVGTDLRYQPVIINEAKIQMDNSTINRSLKPVLTIQAKDALLFSKPVQIQSGSGSGPSLSSTNIQIVDKSPTVTKLNLNRSPEKIEKVYKVDSLLKPLTDMIQNSISSDDAKFNFPSASLTISTNVIPPSDGNISQSMGTTLSEYKVALSFGATMSVSLNIPISLTLPMATMNGEFVARASNDAKHTRRVVVNLMGKSLFNKTSIVNTSTFSETDQQELTLNEILSSPAMNTANVIDNIPSLGFNTQFSSSGSVGCRYRVDMDKNHVSATIGPTYSVNLRLAASFGYRDVLEGGIEGIVTLLRGGLEFGGYAGIAQVNGKWRALNTTYVESTLEALKGEVNFFVRYPDLSNWSCFGPCIKKETISIFKTPVAFKLTGRLLEQDNGKDLNW